MDPALRSLCKVHYVQNRPRVCFDVQTQFVLYLIQEKEQP